jgi:hypothetical protein
MTIILRGREGQLRGACPAVIERRVGGTEGQGGGRSCITESDTARGGMQTSCTGGEIGKWPTQAGSRSKKIGGAEHVWEK